MSAQNPKSPSPQRPPPTSGVVIPHAPKWHQRLLARLIYTLACGMAATLRFRLEDRSGLFAKVPSEKIIFAIWHNRLALALVLYRRYVAQRDASRRLAALVSASRDGGMLARVLELFRVEPVRGSSSRRGAAALRELVKWGGEGYDLALTPDGPRGPRYQVQEGVISTAQLTGLLIVPVSYHLQWKFTVKSWDRFQIPVPFARVQVVMGRPLRVPLAADAAGREACRQQLETELRAITRD